MAILSNTGFYGFLSSCKKTISGYVSNFVSGTSGWIIKDNGETEFKSIYARDKIITNEYVYNRIRVTEDEEVITSNGKILSSFENEYEEDSWTVKLDLREGDFNPFFEGDLLQGYYHSPGNSGVIYAVQRMMVDWVNEDQTMIVKVLDGAKPYEYMIVVRVGNLVYPERQGFVKISSKDNNQLFFDNIDSFEALDNPDNVRLSLGRAQMGLVPSWAKKIIGDVANWFGLIADGVILKGTFVLNNGKTVENEISTLETNFEIREGQISSKVSEAKTYADNANESAASSSGSATVASQKASEVQQTVEGFSQTVSEVTTSISQSASKAEDSAKAAAGSASSASNALETITVKESSINQTAQSIDSKVQEVTTQATNAANSAQVAFTKASEAVQTATEFKTTVSEETQKAVDAAVAGADDAITEKVSTEVTQSARTWKVEVMGADAEGNPNQILAAINASEEGIKIEGEKVQITGELLAEAIRATGINVNNNFIVHDTGEVELVGSLTSSMNGCKLVIKPGAEAIQMIDSKGKRSMVIDFVENDAYSIPRIMSYCYNANGTVIASIQIAGGMIAVNTRSNGTLSRSFEVGSTDGSYFNMYIDPDSIPTSGMGVPIPNGKIYKDPSGFLKIGV